MVNRQKYSQSIKIGSLKEIRDSDSFHELLIYFEEDAETYLASKDNDDELIIHWNIIFDEMKNRALDTSMKNKLHYHKIMRDNKLLILRKYLDQIWSSFIATQEALLVSFTNQTGITSFEIALEELTQDQLDVYHNITQDYVENTLAFIGMLQGMINVIFFAFESSCKILATLGCYEFAFQLASIGYVQHQDIFSTLRLMAKENEGTRCDRCLIHDTCNFEINFSSLANVYAYAIKIRMLSDYGDLFYKIFGIANESVEEDLEKINIYFNNIEKVIDGQKTIENHCLGW